MSNMVLRDASASKNFYQIPKHLTKFYLLESSLLPESESAKLVVMVFMVMISCSSWSSWSSGQTGKIRQPGQKGQTGQTDLTFKLDFPGNQQREDFAILAMFCIIPLLRPIFPFLISLFKVFLTSCFCIFHLGDGTFFAKILKDLFILLLFYFFSFRTVLVFTLW